MGRKIDEQKLESLGVLVAYAGRRVLSYGGVILFGTDTARQRYFPDARVSCARFRGTDKAEFIDRMDIGGSVLDAVEQVPKFIRRNTRLAAKIEAMRRRDIPEEEIGVKSFLLGGDWGQIFPLDKSGLGRGQGGSLGTSLVFQFLSNPFRAGS